MSYTSLAILLTDDLFCKTDYKQHSDRLRIAWSVFCKAYSLYYLTVVYDSKFLEDSRFSGFQYNMKWMMQVRIAPLWLFMISSVLIALTYAI